MPKLLLSKEQAITAGVDITTALRRLRRNGAELFMPTELRKAVSEVLDLINGYMDFVLHQPSEEKDVTKIYAATERLLIAMRKDLRVK
ncbi:hypothetical protein GCM10009784_08260 [Arthrobacter parietis]|uniref:Uncharacterized protein n=1 Tax=Arthrobacter parietis TaxID=271434 RepID=A0ABN3AR72_9MICC